MISKTMSVIRNQRIQKILQFVVFLLKLPITIFLNIEQHDSASVRDKVNCNVYLMPLN